MFFNTAYVEETARIHELSNENSYCNLIILQLQESIIVANYHFVISKQRRFSNIEASYNKIFIDVV